VAQALAEHVGQTGDGGALVGEVEEVERVGVHVEAAGRLAMAREKAIDVVVDVGGVELHGDQAGREERMFGHLHGRAHSREADDD
jgi:hypothetical protein